MSERSNDSLEAPAAQTDRNGITRKQLLSALVATAAVGTAVASAGEQPAAAKHASETAAIANANEPLPENEAQNVTIENMIAAEKIAALSFTDAQRAPILPEVQKLPEKFEHLRNIPTPPGLTPPTHFGALNALPEFRPQVRATASTVRGLDRNRLSPEEIAFLSVRELAHLIHSRQISSVELTQIYQDRLKRYSEHLLCAITLIDGMEAARMADQELAAGIYRGPLHGIPYGIKDLFATRGVPTTYGAEPYTAQLLDYDATVVEKLRAAGAILVAKLSMGALAMDDHWFRGRTKNPWNLLEGSSGSSAGSAAATAAGLVGFSIGTETLGSIVSPSNRCRVTGLRPTFGRVSRYGAMELSYTMDKVGPICREAEDCALVFAAICGYDPRDESTVDRSFIWKPRVDWKRLKVGFVADEPDAPGAAAAMEKQPYVQQLRAKGAEVRPVRITPAPDELIIILEVESASAFDLLTRGPQLDSISSSEWPAIFRTNRFVPAVEYLQAQRVRSMVMRRFEQELGDLDLLLAPGIGGNTLALTNFTGHPQAIIPYGVSENGHSRSVSLVGRLFREDRLLAAAKLVQDAAPYSYRTRKPDLRTL